MDRLEAVARKGEVLAVGALLETKLHVPRGRGGLVPRPRLQDRLSRVADTALTLVSAPPGFGKTTLLVEWLARSSAEGLPAAWLSLDQRDNDPALFWSYVVAALQTAADGMGAGVLSLLQPPPPPVDVLLAPLLNDLHASSTDVVLVLDDYHVLDARDVQDGMAFLLEHLPPQLHLVIACRADPALPLARLRARGELVEIRAADLRFTADESQTYLVGQMGLALTPSDVAALAERTEGWVAALQLAALSMRNRADTSAFIEDFAGDDRHVVDLLTEEVLSRQPEEVRQFLLRTCILDRLSGPLCDAVTGQLGGKAMLEALERGNLFVIPLDDRRRWYRYHHLFADVLQTHLLDGQPDEVAELHRRASSWFEQHGEPSAAVRHALAAGDLERAADLMELAIPALRRNRQEATIRGWLEELPDALLRVRPVLSIGFVGALAAGGAIEDIEDLLHGVERWLDTGSGVRGERHEPSAEMIVLDEEEYRCLPATTAMYRAAQAHVRGDVAETLRQARRAIDLSPAGDHLPRAGGTGLLALASWASGDLEAAHQAYGESRAMLQRAGHDSDVLGCTIALADIRVAQGRLDDAAFTYARALGRASEAGAPVVRGTADMHVGMSELLIERNDLQGARQHLEHSRELGEHTGLPQNRYRWRVAMAGIRQIEGDHDGALDLLDEAERLYMSDYFPNVRPLPARKARLHLVRGAVGEASRWARGQDLSVGDELSYLREFEHITLVRVLLARAASEDAERSLREAAEFLVRLLSAAERGRRTGSAIEILLLQALARKMQGDIPAALTCLQRAVTLAEPEGYVRLFADAGPPLAPLLTALGRNGVSRDYVGRLFAAMRTTNHDASLPHALVEPLSRRELEVLRLLGTDLDGPDIARELVVSLNTVRTHTKHIYGKLGVTSRRAAVREGRRLHLL